jgi:hypothetical protein
VTVKKKTKKKAKKHFAEVKRFQAYLKRIAKEKKREESLSKDVSEKARYKFTGCATDRDHKMIVCVWCDSEHNNPWCSDCFAKRCRSCDKCKGCKESIANCLCENFPE